MKTFQCPEYAEENILKYMLEEYKECGVEIKKIPQNNNTYLWSLSIFGKQSMVPTLYIGEDLAIVYRIAVDLITRDGKTV